MFKKYPKSYLDKEITSPGDTDYSPLTLPFPSALRTQPLPASLAPAPSVPEQEISEEPETTISENVSMRGSLIFQNVLRIDGTFEGELVSQGKLIVGPKAHVKADINLDEAFISGKVEGNIRVRNRLVLRGRAEIKGDISALTLSVDEGVQIMGHVKVGHTESNPLSVELENPLLF